MQLLQSISTRGKLALAGCALGVGVIAFVLVRMASAPSYTELMAGLDPAQTGKISSALDGQGIGYELRSNGTALAVDKGKVAQARVALASAGLDGQKQPGFELLDKQKLGASNFQQQVAYQRALEGQIANTVDQIDGVNGAQVSLTLPKDDLFTDEGKQATAAVLLGGGATTLDPGAVRGIANLVASSVQGLKTESVTITDGSGQLLWPSGDATSAGGPGGASKQAAQARYDSQLEASLGAMLTNTLGPGKAQVQVHSDLNVDQATQEKLEYADKGVPLKSTAEDETLTGTGGGSAGGAAGATTNIPTYAQTGAGGGKSNYKHTTKSTEFGVNKTVTRTKLAPGTVNRLDVALVVDKGVKLSPAELTSLQNAVKSAAGLTPARGDTFAFSQVAFAKPAASGPAAAGPIPAGIAGYLKGAAIGLGALAFIFFVTRFLRRKEDDAFAQEPSWLRQLQAGGPVLPGGEGAAMAAPRLDEFDPQAAARKVFHNDPRALALDDLVQREPEKVAQQLRSWITEDGS
jgi:flagellar M-ring protein FliF